MSEPRPSGLQFEKQLYSYSDAAIRIDIRLGFEGEQLKLDGYDIGEKVRAILGDSDYEYSIAVGGEDLEKLYVLVGLEVGRKQALVEHLAGRFHTHEAFSAFKAYLTANEIRCAVFTWV